MTINTIGFGVPASDDQPKFILSIPRGGKDSDTIQLIEFDPSRKPGSEEVVKAEIDGKAFKQLRPIILSFMNRRLKKSGLKTGKLKSGDNDISEVIGKELCVLMWAADGCDAAGIERAYDGWTRYTLSELWWMYKQGSDNLVWRKALSIALTE